jgi:hypothetical protein
MVKKSNFFESQRQRRETDKIIADDDFISSVNKEDKILLEKKKAKLLKAKSDYQRLCREFIELWMKVKGSKKSPRKKVTSTKKAAGK